MSTVNREDIFVSVGMNKIKDCVFNVRQKTLALIAVVWLNKSPQSALITSPSAKCFYSSSSSVVWCLDVLLLPDDCTLALEILVIKALITVRSKFPSSSVYAYSRDKKAKWYITFMQHISLFNQVVSLS